MTYYLFVQNNEIIGKGQCKNLSVDQNVEVTETLYNDYVSDKYIIQAGNVVQNPDYESILAQKEAERIAMLNLTAADVERAIYKAKGIDFEDIITMVQAQPLSEEGTPILDIKALKIELRANNFYRGSEWVATVGAMLGFTPKQLDEFFETNDYTKLLTPEVLADTDSDSDTDNEESEV